MDKIGIVNAALMLIGEEKLNSLTDSTKSARLANTIYAHCEGYVYELEDWHFLTTRAELAQLADPSFGKYDHRYGLPSGCKRIIATIDEADDDTEFGWEKELFIDGSGNKQLCILCSEDEVYVRYLVDVGENGIGLFPAWFCRLISLQIALYLVQPIVTGGQGSNNPLYYKLRDLWDKAFINAITQNARDKAEVKHGVRSDKGNNDILNAPTDSLTGADTIIDRVTVLDNE